MTTRIEIGNFRGIAKGCIDNLMPLSVLVGRNNSGKSTVLESLYLATNACPNLLTEVARRRGWCGLGCFDQIGWDRDTLFSVRSDKGHFDVYERYEASEGIGLNVAYGFDVSEGTSLAFDTDGMMITPHSYQNPRRSILIDPDTVTNAGMLEDAYSTALNQGKESEIDALVKAIDPTGPSLRILKKGDRYVLHTVTSERAVSVYFGGDGFKRLLFVAFNLAAYAGKQVLLEEPECFQHPSYLGRLASLIWAAIEQGTQVVMSTHSLELLNHLFLAEGYRWRNRQSSTPRCRMASCGRCAYRARTPPSASMSWVRTCANDLGPADHRRQG